MQKSAPCHRCCDSDRLGPDSGIPRHGRILVQATRSIYGPSGRDRSIEVAIDRHIAMISSKVSSIFSMRRLLRSKTAVHVEYWNDKCSWIMNLCARASQMSQEGSGKSRDSALG